jgi:hypothetical protein
LDHAPSSGADSRSAPRALGTEDFSQRRTGCRNSTEMQRQRPRLKRLMGIAELCKPDRQPESLLAGAAIKAEGNRREASSYGGHTNKKKRGEGAGPALNPRRDPRLPFPRLTVTLHVVNQTHGDEIQRLVFWRDGKKEMPPVKMPRRAGYSRRFPIWEMRPTSPSLLLAQLIDRARQLLRRFLHLACHFSTGPQKFAANDVVKGRRKSPA